VFPLKDNIPTLRFPIVTVLLIVINFAVFAYEITRPDLRVPTADGQVVVVPGFDEFTTEWGFVPCELTDGCKDGDLLPVGGGLAYEVPSEPPPLTLLTSMFMHGGWLHILGNMLFLWIFGNNVEDSMGRLRFVVFYLLCGILASLAQVAVDPSSGVPNIGASGAIAGVLGGYILLYPRARVLTAVVLIVFFTFIEVPAYFMLGVWFLLQVLDGSTALGGDPSGGVAYFAHIGGFVAGVVLIKLFARRRAGVPPGQLAPSY
jgi:membrane associated rhomboid family serine protease